MRRLHPHDAPPSLVIVVDEFATLVKEVPEFVDGVVDIAQRGRSLGIHLILATQRPSGAVNDNILANTNLRICLRMLDKTESMAVIASGEAAEIPVPLKGRGWVRLGPRALVAFQAAYCGSPLLSDDVDAPVLVAPFEHTDDSPKALAGPATGAGTHLDAVLRAISEAHERLALPASATPWRDVLPERLVLADVLVDPRAEPASDEPGKLVAVGLIDAPERQDQFPAIIDLEDGSGWLVFGSGGVGQDDAAAHVGGVGDHHRRARRRRRHRPRLRLPRPRFTDPAAAGRRRRHRRRSRGGDPSPRRARRRARASPPPALGGAGREPGLVQRAPRPAAAGARPRRRLRWVRLDVRRGQLAVVARAARELARALRQPGRRRPPGRHPRRHDGRPAQRRPRPPALGRGQPPGPARRRRDGLHRARHPPRPRQGPDPHAGHAGCGRARPTCRSPRSRPTRPARPRRRPSPSWRRGSRRRRGCGCAAAPCRRS